MDQGPYVAKYADLWRYDNISWNGLLTTHAVLKGAQKIHGHKPPSVALKEALFVRTFDSRDELDKKWAARETLDRAIKAGELNATTVTSHGDEWAALAYASAFWDQAFTRSRILSRVWRVMMPERVEKFTIPVLEKRPDFFAVAQAADQTANPGYTDHTVRTDKAQTNQNEVTAGKIGVGVTYTGELYEDSAVNWGDAMNVMLIDSAIHTLDSMLIDGDTKTGNDNINQKRTAGALDATSALTQVDGFRKYAIGHATNDIDFGGQLIHPLRFIDLVEKLDSEGIEMEDFTFILPTRLYHRLMRTILNGDAPASAVWYGQSSWGLPFLMFDFHICGYHSVATPDYSPGSTGKSDSDGRVSTDDDDNTKSSFVCARLDQWLFFWRRFLTMEVKRRPSADVYELTSLMRVAVANRAGSKNAAAIGRNIGL